MDKGTDAVITIELSEPIQPLKGRMGLSPTKFVKYFYENGDISLVFYDIVGNQGSGDIQISGISNLPTDSTGTTGDTTDAGNGEETPVEPIERSDTGEGVFVDASNFYDNTQEIIRIDVGEGTYVAAPDYYDNTQIVEKSDTGEGLSVDGSQYYDNTTSSVPPTDQGNTGTPDTTTGSSTNNGTSTGSTGNMTGTTGDTTITNNTGTTENTETTGNTTGTPHNEDYEKAYNRCSANGLTSAKNILEARMHDGITRAEMAKLISLYVKKFMNKKIETVKTECANFSDINQVNGELQGYITEACNLGLMGYWANGVDIKPAFSPNEVITRAEVATVLSRMLRANTYAGTENYWYQSHL
jgi:hypothetical protein